MHVKIKPNAPLADALRPAQWHDVVGQEHLLAPGAPLARMLESGRLQSCILWGPPGCGKTTIARLMAQAGKGHARDSNPEPAMSRDSATHGAGSRPAPESDDYFFETVSAVTSGTADLKAIFARATERRTEGQGTLLFVDEVHRFNRAQQDVLLPFVEDGTVVLVGATTANPSFELNAALLSRCRVFALRRLDDAALAKMVENAEASIGHALPLTDEARALLPRLADGDGRYLLTLVETLSDLPPEPLLDEAEVQAIAQKRAAVYDKTQDEHYNLISALHKSLRGSDTDAALYWFSRMLEGGEDPRYIVRRLIRFAVEDIGLADPEAVHQALAAAQVYERLGSPEGELAIAQAVIYLGTAPKSNAAYVAYKAARKDATRFGSEPPPKHILNAPTKLMKQEGYGVGYAYDHDTADGFSGQDYFPDTLPRRDYYHPVERGFEREVKKRLDYWARLRKEKNGA